MYNLRTYSRMGSGGLMLSALSLRESIDAAACTRVVSTYTGPSDSNPTFWHSSMEVFEEIFKHLHTKTSPGFGKHAMIRDGFIQVITKKPPVGHIDLNFSHQPSF